MKFGDWAAKFSAKYSDYLAQLADLGENIAQYTFDLVDTSTGNGGVEVTTEQNDGGTGFRIIATGDDAPFIEFGTGVETMTIRPTVQADYPIEQGSWSEANDGMFAEKGYWYYRGTRYTGTAALAPMQYACNEMEHMFTEIARRVFR